MGETILHVGARVATISLEQAEHVYPIRHALANLATGLAVPRITEAELYGHCAAARSTWG